MPRSTVIGVGRRRRSSNQSAAGSCVDADGSGTGTAGGNLTLVDSTGVSPRFSSPRADGGMNVRRGTSCARGGCEPASVPCAAHLVGRNEPKTGGRLPQRLTHVRWAHYHGAQNALCVNPPFGAVCPPPTALRPAQGRRSRQQHHPLRRVREANPSLRGSPPRLRAAPASCGRSTRVSAQHPTCMQG